MAAMGAATQHGVHGGNSKTARDDGGSCDAAPVALQRSHGRPSTTSLVLYYSPGGVRMNQAAPVASPLPLNEKRGKKKEEDEKWNERRRERPRG